MQPLKLTSLDGVAANIDKIAALFPNCVTETISGYDKQGNPILKKAIDFDMLRQELSGEIVEGRQERYQFTWPDKRKAILAANAPITATLRPVREDSVDFDTTENLYIEGDNLDVLKLLQQTYMGKIKLIYIDPPYNTGNDFVYNDDFSEDAESYLADSGQFDDQGNRLVTNTESNGRFHTDWLNMMYPRLKLAKNLLSEDGVIFISIDDNEAANLIKVCSEIFGSTCFVADIAWQKTYSPRNNNLGVATEIEHIVVYGRSANWIPNKLPRTDSMDSKYKNPDNDKVAWKTTDANAPGALTHQGMVYAIQNPFTGELCYPAKGRCWCREQPVMLSVMRQWADYELKEIDDAEQRANICGIDAQDVRTGVCAIMLSESVETACIKAQRLYKSGPWPIFYFTSGGKGGIARKTYLDKVQDRTPTNLWPYSEVGHTDEAKKELKHIFDGAAPFDTPKPTRLLERIVEIATDQDSIVLDFFSGSATTAHSVMMKNASDGGRRKFILAQIGEKCTSAGFASLCEIGKERIRRAGAKIKEESPLTTQNLDTGFRVLRLDSSNMEDVWYTPGETEQISLDLMADNIKSDRTPEDLLFQVMLELAIPLSAKIEELDVCGKKVFSVAHGYLLACFDSNVTEETVTEIAKREPYYAVFRDSSMANDSVANNFDQIFETYSAKTVRKVL